MLVLSRQRDETIMIGDEVEVTIVDIRGDKVRLGISAPREVSVHRKEVYEAIKRENRAAAEVRPQDLPRGPARSDGPRGGGAAGKLQPVRPRTSAQAGEAGGAGDDGEVRPTLRLDPAASPDPQRHGRQRRPRPESPAKAPPTPPLPPADDGPPPVPPPSPAETGE